ncbi:hypothetical protein ACTFIZ_012339 [Dictyostelium cf. discoideum]
MKEGALFIFPFDMERIDRINLELSNLPLGTEQLTTRIVNLIIQEPDYLDMFTRRNYIGACGKCKRTRKYIKHKLICGICARKVRINRDRAIDQVENEYVENMVQIESTELRRAQRRNRVGESGVRIMQIRRVNNNNNNNNN